MVTMSASVAMAAPPLTAVDKREVVNSLRYVKGNVDLGNGLAQLRWTDKFVYLDRADAATFLTRVWDNPPALADRILGMILPADVNPLTPEGWGVIIRYDAIGYVSDADASSIDYTDLMAKMKEATAEASKERVQNGYESYELIGWATQPHYDPREKKLYWAKELLFGGSDRTLNYEIRVLGRKGALNLNVVASMEALRRINMTVPSLLSMVSFTSGNTYAEYDSKIDPAAAYGIGGLIAGGLLMKSGKAGLLAVLLAGKKLWGFAALLIGGLLFRFFRRRAD
jgi:uncharacterized membrane-anchored protein